MKKLIRFLAKISGVEKEIKNEERKHIGDQLIQDGYWFTSGIVYKEGLKNISNFATLYGESLRENKIPSVSKLRDDLYKMSKQNLSVYEDREVYGYWNDDKEPHFIKSEDYKEEEGYKPQVRIKFN